MTNFRNIATKIVLKYKYKVSKKNYIKNINHYIANNNMRSIDISPESIKKYIKKWEVLDNNVSTKFFVAYSNIYGRMDLNYVPDYLYRYPIEKILLNRRYSTVSEDKNLYDKIHNGLYKNYFPHSFLRNIEGVYYDRDYNYVENPLGIIKNWDDDIIVFKESIDTGSGKGIEFFEKNPNNGLFYHLNQKNISLIDFILKKRNFLLQKKVKQHSFLNEINPTSVNTVRVVTYRSVVTENIHIMQVLIKRGGLGKIVDNLNSGGSFVEVNEKGELAKHGIDMYGRKIPLSLSNNLLPGYNDITLLAKEIARQDYYHRQLFFDFFIDSDNSVKIMEINHSAHPPIQAVCGPAFGEFTDEVIEYCLTNPGYLNIPIKFYWINNQK